MGVWWRGSEECKSCYKRKRNLKIKINKIIGERTSKQANQEGRRKRSEGRKGEGEREKRQ